MMKKGDIVTYRGDDYKIFWIGITGRSKKYMARIRAINFAYETWAPVADLTLKEEEKPKIRLTGYTKIPCDDCLDLCAPGTICPVSGDEHV